MRAVLVSLAIGAALFGCFKPDFPQGLRCGKDNSCPPGQTCELISQRCGGDGPGSSADAATSSTDANLMPAECNDTICDPASEDCTSCPEDCGACAGCGDGTCAGAERCLECPDDCGTCSGDCCSEHDSPGCDDPEVTNCVCAINVACCQGPWNAACLNLVNADICILCPAG